MLPYPLPLPPKLVKQPESLKRPAPEEDEVMEPPAKRVRTNGVLPDVLASPSKKRKLEEDGIIMLETANEALEDDIIELD